MNVDTRRNAGQYYPGVHANRGGLSAEDREKLDGIETQAQRNVKPDWDAAPGSAAEILNKPTIPGSVPMATDYTPGKVLLTDSTWDDNLDVNRGLAATPRAVALAWAQAAARQPAWDRYVADFGTSYTDDYRPFLPASAFPLKVVISSEAPDAVIEFKSMQSKPVVGGKRYSLRLQLPGTDTELASDTNVYLYLDEAEGTESNSYALCYWTYDAYDDHDAKWYAAVSSSYQAVYKWNVGGAAPVAEPTFPNLSLDRQIVSLRPYCVNMSQPHDGSAIEVAVERLQDAAVGLALDLSVSSPHSGTVPDLFAAEYRKFVWVLDCMDLVDAPVLVWPESACGADRPETGSEADENLVALPGKVNVFHVHELGRNSWLVKRYTCEVALGGGSSSSSSSGSSGGGGGGTLTTAYYSDGTSRSYWMGYLANESDWYDALYDAFNPYASEKITRIVVGDEVEDGGFDLEALLGWLWEYNPYDQDRLVIQFRTGQLDTDWNGHYPFAEYDVPNRVEFHITDQEYAAYSDNELAGVVTGRLGFSDNLPLPLPSYDQGMAHIMFVFTAANKGVWWDDLQWYVSSPDDWTV